VSVVLPPLRDVIAAHGLSASKALGQNFLLDSQLLDRIAAVPGPLAGQHVYEVGPGPGGLTRALLKAGATVTAVERDRRCLPALEALGDAYPGHLRVIEADALALSLDAVLPTGGHIVANLPYNIGTALLVNWLSPPPVSAVPSDPKAGVSVSEAGAAWPPRWASLTLMFQREVAERIVATPDTSAYGRLAILSQWRCAARIAMTVHRSAFTPPPKVMSAVVHITPAACPEGVNAARLETLTAAAFGQRRKMLRQSVKHVAGALDALDALGIDPTRRAETLNIADFVAVARRLS